MRIKDVMTKNVQVVSPDTSLDEVAKKMQKSDCGSVVVAENDRLVGMITDRDIALRCVAENHHPSKTKAAQIMTKEILYCREDDTIEDVAGNMTKNKVRRLPVLNKEKRLVGIVSLGNLAVHSSDHVVCGRALGSICASGSERIKQEKREHRL